MNSKSDFVEEARNTQCPCNPIRYTLSRSSDAHWHFVVEVRLPNGESLSRSHKRVRIMEWINFPVLCPIDSHIDGGVITDFL